ncbi:MAG: hypothetical protein AB4372_05980, partial [Xenococcus sp. (in: cyanobacteria)]
AEWHYVLSINNQNSSIKESDIKITLCKVEKPHTQENPDSSEAILIDKEQEDNVFCYYFDENHPKGPWHPPFFRLSITNNSQTRKFWVTALYCGVDYSPDKKGYYTSTAFSITNRFLRKEELNRGHVAKMTDEIHEFNTNRRIEYESIQLSLLDDYFAQGYNEIKDTIKIFISTEEIDSNLFNTKGIPIDVEGVLPKKQLGTPILFQRQPSDWCTFEIPITIVKPRDLGILDFGQSKSFYGLTIVGHPHFSARIILSTMNEFIRSTKVMVNEHQKDMPRPEILYGNENVSTIKLTNGIGEIEGCSVIEFYREKGGQSINDNQPLVFKIDLDKIIIEDKNKLILIGYSPQERAYFSLGNMNENQEIIINKLPLESISLINGIGNSIKLILLNVNYDFQLNTIVEKGVNKVGVENC